MSHAIANLPHVYICWNIGTVPWIMTTVPWIMIMKG